MNHTFTSHLALSASLQPFAGLAEPPHLRISLRPQADRPGVHGKSPCNRTGTGKSPRPDAPGLGIEINPEGVRKYLLDVEIKVSGRTLYVTPELI